MKKKNAISIYTYNVHECHPQQITTTTKKTTTMFYKKSLILHSDVV